jgi:thiol-disulfide isomerase/thioredoxin
MKRFLLVFVLLLTSCTCANSEESKSIDAFAPCSSIKTTGMKADGTFVECLEGEGEVALESIEGPAVISAWASWCSNCEAQRENFIRLYEEAGAQLQVVGVDMEEASKSDGYENALKRGMTYPQLFDPDGRSIDFFGPGVPITRFVDASGNLAHLKIGGIFTYDEMLSLVKKHLGIDVP